MKKNRFKRTIFYVFTLLSVLFIMLITLAYRFVFTANTAFSAAEHEVFIPEKASVEELTFLLQQDSIIAQQTSFALVAALKRFHMPSKGGRYIIQKGWSNNKIINVLRVGEEVPVRLTFNNIRTVEELSARFAAQLSVDSAAMMKCFNDYEFIHALGFDYETIIAMFIPNTYEMYWTTSAKGVFNRMKMEYDKFWNEERLAQAKKIGFKPIEVITIASIIDEETLKGFEKPIMAGVYINRLKRGIPLQACPTLKFALNDFTLQRILTVHKAVESPYNTYKYKGLPPGPIRVPAPTTIDAVLYYKASNYLYFCAKDDFSGEHYFSATLREHNIYAKRYQNELNKRRIYK